MDIAYTLVGIVLGSLVTGRLPEHVVRRLHAPVLLAVGARFALS